MTTLVNNPDGLLPGEAASGGNVGDGACNLEHAPGIEPPVVQLNFASRPAWLKRAGDEYTTSIRVLNVNKNKDHSLSTFLTSMFSFQIINYSNYLTSMFSFRIINYSNYSLPLYYSLNLELEAAYPFGTWFKNL